MRAAVLYGKEDVRVVDVPCRPLAVREVRVAIRAALTCGTDLKVFKRGYHARMIVPPALFGHELAGTISEIGEGVNGWKPGEAVVVANSAPCGECFFCRESQENLCDDLHFLNGAYAESIVVPARFVEKNMLKLPRFQEGVDPFMEGALTEPFACVVQGVSDLQLKGTENVLVLGTGPIGLMFLKLCKHLGCRVSMAGRSPQRMERALQLGAEEVFQISEDHNIADTIKAQTRMRYDVVIEAVGKPETWEASVNLARKGGKVNFFGGCPAGTAARLDTGLVHYSNLTLLASFHHTPRTIRKALSLIEAGVISSKDFVDGECTLEQLPDLLRSMAGGNKSVKTCVRLEELAGTVLK
ncbi:MAG: zinc-dependent alcohol dehydrogenase [Verrucomicrobiales bacterium]